jgi:hypothetical protein
VRITCDNSVCDKAVTGIKVKLKRKIDIRLKEYDEKSIRSHFSEYIASKKFEGCKANEKKEGVFELEIPIY